MAEGKPLAALAEVEEVAGALARVQKQRVGRAGAARAHHLGRNNNDK